MPTRKWIIAYFEDGTIGKESLEHCIKDDADFYRSFSQNPNVPEPVPVLEPIPVSALLRTETDFKDDIRFVEARVISRIRKVIHQSLEYVGIALLLDRDMLAKHGAVSLYAPIVKHTYFEFVREPDHYVFCCGGAPGGIRCKIESQEICSRVSHRCNCDADLLISCNHTCYWHFIGRLLDAYKNRTHTNSKRDEEICKELPPPYKY